MRWAVHPFARPFACLSTAKMRTQKTIFSKT